VIGSRGWLVIGAFCARTCAWLRLVIFRCFVIEVIGVVALLASVLTAGIFIGVYWTFLAAYIRCHDLGNLIHQLFPVLGAIGGIVVFWWQVWRARYNQRIDLIVKFAERFDKAEMRAMRANAARALQRDRTTDDSSVIEVLNFFEDISFLLTRKAIDDDAVYEFFSYWAMRYYFATIAVRREMNRDVDAPVYGKTRQLAKILMTLTVQKSKAGKMPFFHSKTINDFLLEEAKLVSQTRTKFSFSNNVSRTRWTASRWR